MEVKQTLLADRATKTVGIYKKYYQLNRILSVSL